MRFFPTLRRRLTKAYLSRHHKDVLAILQEAPEIASQAALTAYQEFEAANGGPTRETMDWPILTHFGTGLRFGTSGTLPKMSAYNLRRFCFDEKTDVLTQRGWVLWPDIVSSDVFATLNILSGMVEWHRPKHLFSYRVDGEMVRFQSRDIDALVTPEHKMLGRYRKFRSLWKGEVSCPECGKRFAHASGMGAHRRYIHNVKGVWRHQEHSYDYSELQLVPTDVLTEWLDQQRSSASAFEIPFTAEWPGAFPPEYSPSTGMIPVKCYPSSYVSGPAPLPVDVLVSLADLVAFFGIYIAEGSASGSYAGIDDSRTSDIPHWKQIHNRVDDMLRHPKGYHVRIAQTPGDSAKEIYALLKRLPWRFRVDHDGNGFSANCKYLWEMVHSLGTTYTKYVPLWIKNLPPAYLRIFLDWAIKGDGCIRKDGIRLYFTTSPQLADDMQEIFQRAGKSARLTKKAPRGSAPWNIEAERCAPQYWLTEKTRDFYGIHAKHVMIEEYHGQVYCAELPNKTVYIRRNGKAFWCGRSEYPPSRRAINAICNPILDMPWEIRRQPDPLGKPLPKEPTTEQENHIRALTNAFTRPNNDLSWRSWLEQVLEDIVVGGYGASEIAKHTDPQRPVYLWPVDGQSIRIKLDWDGKPTGIRYAQSQGYLGGGGIGSVEGPHLRDDQLLYFKLNPRTNTPFGLGYLETAFLSINAYLGAFDYATKRASNNTPNFIIFLGENIDVNTARQWQQYWTSQIEGQARAPIIGGGRQPTVLPLLGSGDDALFLKWQEFLIRNIAMAFGLSASTLGLERDVNRSTAETQNIADWDTVAPVANLVADYLTNKLIHSLLGWTDLEFRWMIRDTDELRQAEIIERQYDTNGITINEVRELWDREPTNDEWGMLTKSQYEAKAKALYEADLGSMGGPPLLDEEEEEETPEEESITEGGVGSGELEAGHTHGVTMIRFAPELEHELRQYTAALIEVDDLAPDEGIETAPHATIKYGITEDIARALPLIYPVASTHSPISGTFGPLILFEAETHDVLVLSLQSDDMVRMNNAISEAVPHINTFRNFRPHMTLAYLKKGRSDAYLDAVNPFEGRVFTCDALEFIDSKGNRTSLSLHGT